MPFAPKMITFIPLDTRFAREPLHIGQSFTNYPEFFRHSKVFGLLGDIRPELRDP